MRLSYYVITCIIQSEVIYLVNFKKNYSNYSDYSEDIIPELNKLSYRPRILAEEKYSHSVTSLSQCLRQQWFKITGTNKTDVKIDEKVKKLQAVNAWADTGNFIEDYIIERFKLAGLYLGDQIRVKIKNPNISGAIDLLIYTDDYIIPVEIKSAKSSAFYGVKNYSCPSCGKLVPYKNAYFCKNCHSEFKEPDSKTVFKGIVDKPKFDHYCQLQLYIYMVNSSLTTIEYPCYKFDLDTGSNLNFEYGLLFYHCKDDHSEKVWKLQPDINIGNWLVDRAETVDTYLKDQEMPPREYNPHGNDYQCNWCEWKTLCQM